ncbi:hypothetical protein AOC36_10035 [Erysipelothrix larvae]|uniref:Bacteriophage T5 Orf172 DNA-binding domain-containing protein n=1 Tax=Erysipelothrix larvae TaxID=1514105 RepID=A0A0X8H1F0_9FIRM|nr:GIY-YIG nuclease family protein [Erysipelothrix larvae]AMC94297.1 hypothetical protein AOC36_10035 [Erysipelothrix larvae]
MKHNIRTKKWFIIQLILITLVSMTWLLILTIPLGILLIKNYLKELNKIGPVLEMYPHLESLEIQKDSLYSQIQDLKDQVPDIERENLAILEDKKSELENRCQYYEKQIEALKDEKSSLLEQTKTLESYLNTDFVDTHFDLEDIHSEEIQNQVALLRTEVKRIINDTIQQTSNVKVSIQASMKDQYRKLFRLFIGETDSYIEKATPKNIDTQRSRIMKLYDSLNALFKNDGISLDSDLLKLKLEELAKIHLYNVRKEQEREEQKAIKEQMLEEAKAERELEQAKRAIEKEITQFSNESKKLFDYLNKANSDVEREIYVTKIKELEHKLNQLQLDKKDVENRQLNTRAGYIYIISNIGSFGENIYKIGLTRRLEPMDRVRELGSASVPFEFDVHAMIFSDDAPQLEATLHNTFKEFQVNRVNTRKEFFNVSLEQIERVVKEHHNATVTFTMKAQAVQYYESLRILKLKEKQS